MRGSLWQMPGGKIRLFVTADLGQDAEVPLTPTQAHYLFTVMRLGPGRGVAVFNGRDGEWLAEVAGPAGRRGGGWSRARPGRPQRRPPDLWLVFAPIKKARTDFIVEKAAELGAARRAAGLHPLTERRAAAARPAAGARDRGGRAVRRDLRAGDRRAGRGSRRCSTPGTRRGG